MTKSRIDLATLLRIERTAVHVRSTVQQAFVRLESSLQKSTDPRFLEKLELSVHGQEVPLNNAADVVTALAEHLLRNLFVMCEVITHHSDPTPEIRARFAHILSRNANAQNGPVVNLRQRRLLQLPIEEALEIVLGDLETICAEIDRRAGPIVDHFADGLSGSA